MMLVCPEGRHVICGAQHLVSVSVIGSHDDMTDESLSSAVHQEMSQWFGDKQTADWKLLKVYRVSFAQPNQVTMLSLLTYTSPVTCFLHKVLCVQGAFTIKQSVYAGTTITKQ